MKSDRISASHATAAPVPAITRDSRETGARAPEPPRELLGRREPRGAVAGGAAARRRGALLRRLVAGADWSALALGLVLATATAGVATGEYLLWALVISPVWILVFKLQGLYDNDHRRIRHSTVEELSTLLSGSVLGTVALDALLSLSPAGALPSSTAILLGFYAFAATIPFRAATRLSFHHLTEMANGLVIGSSASVSMLARRVATHPEAQLRLVGYLGPEPQGNGAALTRLGNIAEIPAVASEHAIERVIVAEDDLTEHEADQMIADCKAAGLALTFLPRHHGLFGPGVELNRVAELPVLDFRFSDPPRSTMLLKRAMDIAVSGALLILLTPACVLITIATMLDSGWPVLFRQTRIGLDGRSFTMLKFRTMVHDAEERLGELIDLDRLEEPAFKIPDDPRVTRVGRILRRTSLDEIPQLLNVFWGDMSLVGPRPEEEAIVALYDDRQRARLEVKPGLTGPMQVYGRGDLAFEERLAMERDYLDNLSIAGDLGILMRTPRAIVRGNGAY